MRAASAGSIVSRLFRRISMVGFVAAIAMFGAPVVAQVTVTVPGTANPYLSGMPNGSTCCSGDSAPAQSPVQVTGLALAGATLTFTNVTGAVTFDPNTPATGPDGGFTFTTTGTNGISGATWPANALVGVFLNDSLPTSSPAPADLNFSGTGTAFTTLTPALKQVFFIGDGRTGTGTGATQTFVVPAGATRLFLGVADGIGWFNNVGSFSVTVSIVAAPPPPPPLPTAIQIPTLSLPMSIVLLLALGGIGAYVIRRA